MKLILSIVLPVLAGLSYWYFCGSNAITVWDIAKSPDKWNGKQVTVRGFCDFVGGYEVTTFLAASESESRKRDLGVRIAIRTVANKALARTWDKPFKKWFSITGIYRIEDSVMCPYGILDEITSVEEIALPDE